jgi:hypothetical protein
MKFVVRNSVKLNEADPLPYDPFLLSDEENVPTHFEMVFLSKTGERVRYGFRYTEKAIVDEWLYIGSVRKEKALFLRTEEGIGVDDSFEEGKGKEESTNDNRLFLSLVAQLGGEISKRVMTCFYNYNVISGIDDDGYVTSSKKMLKNDTEIRKEALSLFRRIDLGFTNIEVVSKEFDVSDLPDDMPLAMKEEIAKDLEGKKRLELNTFHNRYSKEGYIIDNIPFNHASFESEGTKKIISLSGPVFDTLRTGKLLVIDELDAKLHAFLTMEIIKLFNNKKTNPHNAQLLFVTHDTNLLNSNLFRRDQIWFAEKDQRAQTDLYSLQDFVLPDGNKVRNDANIEKNYLRGRFGAIPFITH